MAFITFKNWEIGTIVGVAILGWLGVIVMSIQLNLFRADIDEWQNTANGYMETINTLTHQKGNLNTRLQSVKAHRDRLLLEAGEKQVEVKFLADYVQTRNELVGRPLAELLAAAFIDAGEEFDLDPVFLAAVAEVESHFKLFAKSNKRAVGVMQVVPQIWVKLLPFVESADDLYNLHVNVRAGAYILAHYRRVCGPDYQRALQCYNGGPRARLRPRDSTRDYVRDILFRWKAIELRRGAQ